MVIPFVYCHNSTVWTAIAICMWHNCIFTIYDDCAQNLSAIFYVEKILCETGHTRFTDTYEKRIYIYICIWDNWVWDMSSERNLNECCMIDQTPFLMKSKIVGREYRWRIYALIKMYKKLQVLSQSRFPLSFALNAVSQTVSLNIHFPLGLFRTKQSFLRHTMKFVTTMRYTQT